MMKITINRGIAGSKAMHRGICGFHVPEYVGDTNEMVAGYPLIEVIFGFTVNRNAFNICEDCWEKLKTSLNINIYGEVEYIDGVPQD